MCQGRYQLNVLRFGAAILLLGVVLNVSPAAAADAPPSSTTQPAADETDALPLISSGLDAKGNSVTLTVNQSRLIALRVTPKVVDVTQPDVVLTKFVPPKSVVLTGLKPGAAQLVVWDDKGRSQAVDVTALADIGGLQAALKRVLPDVSVDVTSVNGALVLRGHVPSARVADQVVQIATPYANKVINLLEVRGGQQVTLQVRFAEVSRSAIEALGVNFGIEGRSGFGASIIGQVEPFGVAASAVPDTTILGIPNPTSAVTAFGHFTSGKTAFDVFLTAMKQNNLLRVLAEPNLTTMSGQQATFLAGGEFPYPVPQSGAAGGGGTAITIEFKQFGVRLNFTPVVLGDGRIRLQVSPEVSDLDFTHALQLNGFTIPAITSRNASTVVELSEGQTLALAGLLNTRVNATNTATPLLGDLPIIGALFRSVRYERDETELVVLVTPQLAEGMSPGRVPAVPGERWRYPTEAQLYFRADLGGPLPDAPRVPSSAHPPRFHGSYGFAPAVASGK